MYTFKISHEQKLKLINAGYTLKELQEQVTADMKKAGLKVQSLKICFSEQEVIEWIDEKYPAKLSIEQLYNLWAESAKNEYKKPSMSGLYKHYEKLRAMGRPLVMYHDMAADNKQHKFF